MIGSALTKELTQHELLLPTSQSLDLTDRSKVYEWFEKNRPDFVLNAAARVGGIQANIDFPVDFLLQNIKIQNNLLEAAFDFGVKKSLVFGSACSYPKNAINLSQKCLWARVAQNPQMFGTQRQKL